MLFCKREAFDWKYNNFDCKIAINLFHYLMKMINTLNIFSIPFGIRKKVCLHIGNISGLKRISIKW